MLSHSIIGPREDGRYLVVYLTPGCAVMTAALDCRTESQAVTQADRLNNEQAGRDEAVRRDMALRQMRLMFSVSEKI